MCHQGLLYQPVTRDSGQLPLTASPRYRNTVAEPQIVADIPCIVTANGSTCDFETAWIYPQTSESAVRSANLKLDRCSMFAVCSHRVEFQRYYTHFPPKPTMALRSLQQAVPCTQIMNRGLDVSDPEQCSITQTAIRLNGTFACPNRTFDIRCGWRL